MTVPIVPWRPRCLTVRPAAAGGPGRVRYGEMEDGFADRCVTVEAAPGSATGLTLTLPPASVPVARISLEA